MSTIGRRAGGVRRGYRAQVVIVDEAQALLERGHEPRRQPSPGVQRIIDRGRAQGCKCELRADMTLTEVRAVKSCKPNYQCGTKIAALIKLGG